MVARRLHVCLRNPGTTVFVAIACLSLAGFGTVEKKAPSDDTPLTVPKATCGPNDHPETALQGQVPAALRAAGFKGFNCNLELLRQSKGDGANWQTTEYRDAIALTKARVTETRAAPYAPITVPRRRIRVCRDAIRRRSASRSSMSPNPAVRCGWAICRRHRCSIRGNRSK